MDDFELWLRKRVLNGPITADDLGLVFEYDIVKDEFVVLRSGVEIDRVTARDLAT
jgi:hypothetical protein